jgi:hypothetical protein
VPSNLAIQDNDAVQDSSDESPAVRGHGAGIEAAAIPETSQGATRESVGGHAGQRRNTGGRKHSPSSAAGDQASAAGIASNQPEESMQQLTEKFEAIRKETEEILAQVSKDAEEFKLQMLDLLKEKDEKRQALKEKEEASEKLKKEVHYSERANRQAQNRKTQKEKILRDKQAERTKMHDDMARWRKEIEDMKVERELWKKEKQRLDEEKEAKAEELRGIIRKRQNSLNGLEEEIRVKGLQIKELEEERQHLPGAQDDDESRERDAAEKQRDLEWEIKERDLSGKLSVQSLHLRQLQAELHQHQAMFTALSARQASNPLMYHGNSSGVDFDPTGGQGKTKSRRSRNRKSRTSTISSPIASYPITDSPFPSASAYNNLNKNATSPTFAPGPYFDLSNDTAMVPLSEQMSGMSEADVRALTAGAPLSPTATSLLPSNIFADDDPPSPDENSTRSFGPALFRDIGPPAHENDPQSPSSSSRSASLMSSPRTSAHNLAMYGVSGRDYAVDSDRKSLNSQRADFGAIGSASTSEQSTSHKPFGGIFGFPRARGKTMQEDGPALGTLKQGQSQSFPRSAEEPEAINNRPRRISFSSGWNMPSLFQRSATTSDATEGNGPIPARSLGARRRRGFNMFGSSMEDPIVRSDRDPSSPRPLSIGSNDLPRPSTDSAPFGWPAAESGPLNRNSPLATNWSIHAPQTWSRNPSRRPSIQHGSTTALVASGIASDDDEFLPSDTLTAQTSPPPVGVIGTRPASSHKAITPKLNPAAPAFNATAAAVPPVPAYKSIFSRSSKTDKEKDKGKGKETSDEQSRPSTSPSDSRKSRDTQSIHTQNSISESHESLSLERTSSNTPSEMTTPSASSTKEKDSAFRQLLRKGSQNKFGFSISRGKDSGLFGSGKKPGSSTNSDRNASGERESSFDEFPEDGVGLGRSVESVTSSPMMGSGEWKGKDKDGEQKVGTLKEGRMSVNWGRMVGFKKKGEGRGRESLDVERERSERSEADTTGTEDEDHD